MALLNHLLTLVGGAFIALVLLQTGHFFLFGSRVDITTTSPISVTKTLEPIAETPISYTVASTTAVDVVVTDASATESIDVRFVGLLAHVHWLLDQKIPLSVAGPESVSSNTYRQQIDRIYDSQGRQVRSVLDGSTFTNAQLQSPRLVGNLQTNGFWLSYSGANNGLYIDSLGRVGFGTSTPLEVVNIENGALYLGNFLPSATSNRLYAQGGSLYWNGSLLGGGSSGNWDTDGTHVYRLTGNVGIGTSTPAERLVVLGNGLVSGSVTAASFIGSGTLITGLNADALASGTVSYDRLPISATQVSNWDTAYGWGDHALQGYINDLDTVSIGDLSNVSIAGLATGDFLRFNGTAFINDVLVSGDIPTLDILTKTSGTLSGNRGGTGMTAFVPGQLLFGSSTDALTSSGNLFWDLANNRLGIGTSTPTERLTVVGNVRVTGSFFDSNNIAGATGSVLLSTGSGTSWVATSSLGITGGGGYGGGDLSVDGYVDITIDSAGYRIMGERVLFASSTNQSVVVGIGAGRLLSATALLNTAVGYEALYSAESSGYNTALGAGSMRNTTSGFENTALGYFTLHINTTGSFNAAGGYNSQYNTVSGNFNTSFGHNSLYNNVAGTFNSVYGASAGYDLNTPAGQGANTLIGYNTGRGIITGINNTIIGANVVGLGADLSNNIIIADGEGNRRINILSDGSVGIGTTTPTERLTVSGTIQATNLLGGAVDLSTDENGNIIRKPSDESFKTNIETLSNALGIVLSLRGVQYEWIDKSRFGEQLEVGFIAQEVDAVLPQVVRKGGEYWSLNASNMVAVVVEALKEVWQVVQNSQTRISSLEQENEVIKQRLEQLEQEQSLQNIHAEVEDQPVDDLEAPLVVEMETDEEILVYPEPAVE